MNKVVRKCILPIIGVMVFIVLIKLITYIYLPQPIIIQSIPSPDGNHVAYIYESNGGATTGFIYHLSILKRDEKVKKGKGNTYSSGFEFDVEWINDSELKVYNTSTLKIYRQEERIGDISVEYKYLKMNSG